MWRERIRLSNYFAMAAIDNSQPRRKFATYGKSARKRLPDHGHQSRFSNAFSLSGTPVWERRSSNVWSGRPTSQAGESIAIGEGNLSYSTRKDESSNFRRKPFKVNLELLSKKASVDPPRKSQEKLAKRKSPTRASPAKNGAFDIFAVLPSDEELPVPKKATRHALEGSRSSPKKGFLEFDSAARDPYSIPSSDEDAGLSRRSEEILGRKRRRLGQAQTSKTERGLFDDDALQRHIAMETEEEDRISKPSSISASPISSLERSPPSSFPTSRLITRKLAKVTWGDLAGPDDLQPTSKAKDTHKNSDARPGNRAGNKLVGSSFKSPAKQKIPLEKQAHLNVTQARSSMAQDEVRSSKSEFLVSPKRNRHLAQSSSPRESRSTSSTSPINQDSYVARTTPKQARAWDALLAEVPIGPSPSQLKMRNLTLSAQARPAPWEQGGTNSRNHDSIQTSKRTSSVPTSQPARTKLIDAMGRNSLDDESSESDKDLQSSTDIESANLLKTTSRLDANEPGDSQRIIQPQSSQYGGPKVTYLRQRSYLTDQALDDPATFDMPLDIDDRIAPARRRVPRTAAAPKSLSSKTSEMNQNEDIEGSSNKMKSIHELRLAGGNKRFLDEAEAIFEDVDGTQTTISRKRSGLMDLTTKLIEKRFCEKFTVQGLDARLFALRGIEGDVLASAIFTCAILFILNNSPSSYRVLRAYQEHVIDVLTPLLDFDKDIEQVAKERRTNMSKFAQGAVSALRELVKQSFLWQDRPPIAISPKLLALKALDLIVRKARDGGDMSVIIPAKAIEKMASSLTAAPSESDVTLRALPETALLVSIFESHTLSASRYPDKTQRLLISSVAIALPAILAWSEDTLYDAQRLALRLTINVTNNDSDACGAFAQPEIMKMLYRTVVSKFDLLSGIVEGHEQEVALEHLIITLGTLINFAEWSDAARLCTLHEEPSGHYPVDELLKLFMQRAENAFEVSEYA